MIYVKTVTLIDRVGYLAGPMEAWVEVVWGDPLSRKQCRAIDCPSEIKSLAEAGFNTAAEFVLTAPKSVSVASEVLGDSRVRSAFIKEAQVLGQHLLQKAPLAQELEVPSGNMKARFLMFCHRTTNPRKGPLQPHLNLHLLVFAGVLNGTHHPLSHLDLRPVHARREAFHARFLCGLAHRVKRLGYGVVQTPTGFELAEVDASLLKVFSASVAGQPQGPGRRRRMEPKDLEQLWKTKLGGRGPALVAGPSAPSVKSAAHREELPGLANSLAPVFGDDVFVPLPSLLPVLFRACTGVCQARTGIALAGGAHHRREGAGAAGNAVSEVPSRPNPYSVPASGFRRIE